MGAERNRIRTPDYSPWFSARTEIFDIGRIMILSERAFQKEQIGANVSFIAPSSEEL